MQLVPRPSWDDTFIKIARIWATRSTCPRRSVGCVITDAAHTVLVSGYNGAPRGVPHCSDVGCLMNGSHCIRAVHAEQNAICQAARTNVSLVGASVYTTCRPCRTCLNLLIQVGISEIIFTSLDYRNDTPQGNWEEFKQLCNLVGITWRVHALESRPGDVGATPT